MRAGLNSVSRHFHRDCRTAGAIVRNRTVLLILAILTCCHQQPKDAANSKTDAQTPAPAPAIEESVPAELGKRPPNTRMTSRNMPYFDTVTYCLLTTRKSDKIVKGPAYEACIQLEDATRIVIGEAIDAKEFKEADIVRCAKASHTAYEGMWYCMNDRPYR